MSLKGLTYLYQSDSTTDEDPEQEKRAWKQVNSATRRYIVAEFVMTVVLVMLPLLIFGYQTLQLSYAQIVLPRTGCTGSQSCKLYYGKPDT